MSWETDAATTLEDDRVALRPVAAADREAWRDIAMDPDIWRYFVVAVQTPADFDRFFDAALADQQAGTRVVYSITNKQTGQVAGSMSFGYIAEPEGRLEIGWSWLGAQARGQGINRRAKALMLTHAFDVLGAERVQFRTDVLNLRARRALEKIGATEEGTFRSYNPMPGGRRRNAVFFSVIREEWPKVAEELR